MRAMPTLTDVDVTLCDEVWRIRFVTRAQMPPRQWGECDWEHRVITVRRDLSYRNVLDTLLHELRHAVEPHRKEDWVNDTSTELAHALLATGIVGNGQTKTT